MEGDLVVTYYHVPRGVFGAGPFLSDGALWKIWVEGMREDGWGDDEALQRMGSDGVWRDMTMGLDGWLVPVVVHTVLCLRTLLELTLVT